MVQVFRYVPLTFGCFYLGLTWADSRAGDHPGVRFDQKAVSDMSRSMYGGGANVWAFLALSNDTAFPVAVANHINSSFEGKARLPGVHDYGNGVVRWNSQDELLKKKEWDFRYDVAAHEFAVFGRSQDLWPPPMGKPTEDGSSFCWIIKTAAPDDWFKDAVNAKFGLNADVVGVYRLGESISVMD